MPEDVRERALEKIAQVSAEGRHLVDFWRACTEPIADAIPHYWAPCFFTLDPTSLLLTSHFDEGVPRMPAEWLEREYVDDDVHQLAKIARLKSGVSTLHEATGGDPSSSPRWHANMELGGDQEIITALRARNGDVWGALSLYRDPGRPMFDRSDKMFLRAVAPYLAEGIRRALLLGEACEPEGSDAPGLVVLDSSMSVESMTSGIERWLEDLPDGNWRTGRLPVVIRSVASRAASGQAADNGTATARVRGRSGTWLLVHASPLVTPEPGRCAVFIEPAGPGRLAALLMAAYDLTEREKDVTRLVLVGQSTTDISAALVVSPHTVQQHLKSIFEKTGVRSRRELAGKVFFAHYEPRLRDNEGRAIRGRPLRGGPFPMPCEQ